MVPYVTYYISICIHIYHTYAVYVYAIHLYTGIDTCYGYMWTICTYRVVCVHYTGNIHYVIAELVLNIELVRGDARAYT